MRPEDGDHLLRARLHDALGVHNCRDPHRTAWCEAVKQSSAAFASTSGAALTNVGLCKGRLSPSCGELVQGVVRGQLGSMLSE
eukprot:7448923-Pyramimonas_sp.AAC.1